MQTSPQAAFRQEDIAQQQYQLQQQAIKDAQADMAPTKPTPLQGMAKGTLPSGVSLQTPDGAFTAAGLLSQQTANSQQDLIASQKMMQQANMARAMGDDKSYANLVSEARRLQTTATMNMANAKKEYQNSVDDALESVYGSKSQQEYDQRVKDALERTGIPTPKNLPEIWTPDLKEKILSSMSPEARNQIGRAHV